jgi:O-acetylserine/cysteine efflux transporter
MRPRDMVLAAITSTIWGFAYAVYNVGLEGFSAPQLTALRFLVGCLPVLLVPRPKVPWMLIVSVGLTLFAGQFLLLFFAITLGMPAGLASVTQQMQVFFTVLLSAVLLGEQPTWRQVFGLLVAFAGLVLIGATTGADLQLPVLALALAAALSWAVGNILVKRAPGVPVFALMAWCSLVPPVPALALSAWSAHAIALPTAVANASWASLGAVLYLGTLATPVAYAIWGMLLRRYSSAIIAPFALLSPCVGVLASALILGEVFGGLRYAGMALIFIGLAVTLLGPPAPQKQD